MNRSRLLSVFRLAVAGVLLTFFPVRAALAGTPPPLPHYPPRYTCTIIDDTVGGAFVEADAINNSGQIAGTAVGHLGVQRKDAPGAVEYWHGFLWSNGHFTDLGVLPGSAVSDAVSINDRTQIVGTSGPVGSSGHAYLWQHGHMSALSTSYGLGSEAHCVSNSGVIAGNAENSSRSTEAAVWRIAPGSNPSDVAPWMVPGQADAVKVNNAGDVLCSANYRAYLWRGGKMYDIGTLGGAASTGTAVNDEGEVVGVSTTATQMTHVFAWANGNLVDLDRRPPGVKHVPVINAAEGINNYGRIVGIVTVRAQMHAMLYENGNVDDLNEYIKPYKNLTLEIARAINDRGQIVGTGHVGSRPVSFLLTPIKGLAPVVRPPYGNQPVPLPTAPGG